MAWQTILKKGKDKIILSKDGVELANIIIANSSKSEMANISIEAVSIVDLCKVPQ